MEHGNPAYLVDVTEVTQQAARQDCSSDGHQAKRIQPALQAVSHEVRLRGVGAETSASLYEGAAGLQWQWVQDTTSIALSVAAYRASPRLDSDHDIVIQCYEKFVRKTPYIFALTVEYIHPMPKENALRALHELGLIAPD
jgi:hypothetical protein